MNGRPAGSADEREIAAAAKAFDHDRYLGSLFSASEHRRDLHILFAFAAGVAAIPARVREPRPGEIRLQWWRDALEQPQSERTGNPLADAMREIMHRCRIGPALLIGYIDACEFELERRPMPDAAHLKSYLVKTEATLLLAASRILGGETEDLDACCEVAGIALGGARLVLGFASDLARRRIILPVDGELLSRLEDADLPDENVRHEIDRMLRSEAEKARAGARNAIDRVGRLPRRVRAAFLPIAAIEADMIRWERLRLDPLREVVRPARLQHVWQIWRLHRRWRRAP